MSTTTGFDLSNLTTFINEQRDGLNFWTESLMGNDSFAFANQYGTVLTGVKESQGKLPTLSATATLKDGTECGFTPTDQVTPDQTDYYMKKITVQGQFCVHNLEPFAFGNTLPAGQHYSGFNPLEQAMIGEIQRELARKLALFPYYGPQGSDTITYNYPWIDQLEDAFGINVGTTTITSGGSAGTDAQGAFNVVETIADAFYNDPDTAADANNGNLIVSMSPKVAHFYFQNYRKLFGQNMVAPVMQQLATGNYSTWTHDGTNITIATQNALGLENQVICQRKGNQTLLFDLASDATRIEMGMDQYREYIWWKVRLKMGTAYRSLNAKSVRYWGAAS